MAHRKAFGLRRDIVSQRKVEQRVIAFANNRLTGDPSSKLADFVLHCLLLAAPFRSRFELNDVSHLELGTQNLSSVCRAD
jgi:hypothetical protein